ncbi:MAG: signal peptidase I [Christensenellales bacterium]
MFKTNLLFSKTKKKFNILTVFLNFLGNLFFVYCLIVAIALVIFSSVTIECKVVGPSMQPTLNADLKAGNDIVYVNKFDRDFEYGDIVVIDVSEDKDPLIKRVIGVGGDIIDIVNTDYGYKLEINGKLIEEDYLKLDYSIIDPKYQNGNDVCYNNFKNDLMINYPELFINVEIDGEMVNKLLVPEGQVFVLGDNRHVSLDSTHYGTFKLTQIEGTVERIKYSNTRDFEFYFNYIVKGEFFQTILNCLK